MKLLRSGILLLSTIAAGLLGCNNLDVCGSTPVPLRSSEGPIYRCIVAEDCPRPSRVSVCVTDASPEEECIRCQETFCVRVVPEAC